MKIEKLNENKVRIILSVEDLDARNIDYQSFMAKPIETQEIFFDMLDIAEQEVGFQIRDSRFAIEVIALKDGRFIFTITKYEEHGKAIPSSEKTVPLQARPRRAGVHIKRKAPSVNTSRTIYSFNCLDDLRDFSTFICNSKSKEDVRKFVKKASVFEYNECYYLLLANINRNAKMFPFFTNAVSEFASMVESPELFESKLTEYGKLIKTGTYEVFDFYAGLEI